MSSWPLWSLLLVFALASAAVWYAGIKLSDTTDTLSQRLHLGEALGGLILLALVTNLPEIAITVNAARQHALGLAVGNILGGIAVQTLVLVALDVWGVGSTAPLTYRAASLTLVLEGALVAAVLTAVIMGGQLPASLHFARLTPADLLILALWLSGLWLLGKARGGLPWHEGGQAPDNRKYGPPPDSDAARRKKERQRKAKTATAVGVFLGPRW